MKKATFSSKSFDLISQGVFAEALTIAFAQGEVDPLPPGHIGLETRERGGQYAKWRRFGLDGKPLAPQYLGPAGGEKHLEALARFADLQRLESMAKNLRKMGFASEENVSAGVLAALANAGFFTGGGALVGTRAFHSLMNHLNHQAAPILATQDIDIGRRGSIQLAAPLPEGGMLELLQKTGLRFLDVPTLKLGQASSSWKVAGHQTMVDLLTHANDNHPPYSSVLIPELGANATALEGMDYLLGETIEAIVIGKAQLVPIRAPAPERFLWHKLAVSGLRSSAFAAKSQKDLMQAGCLAVAIFGQNPENLPAAAEELPDSLRAHAMKGLSRLFDLFGDEHADLVAFLSDTQGVPLPKKEAAEPAAPKRRGAPRKNAAA